MMNKKKSKMKWFQKFTLQKKLMFVFMTLTFCAVLTFLGITYCIVENTNEKQVRHSAELSFLQAHDFIQKSVWPVLYASDTIYYNQSVQTIIAQNPGDVSLAQQYRDMLKLQNISRTANNAEELEQIRLYIDDDWVYAHQDVYFSGLKDLDNTAVMSGTENYCWLPPEDMVLRPNEEPKRVISLLRKLHDPDNYAKAMGYVRVSIAAEELDDIVYRSNITQEGLVYLVNENNQLICCSNYERAGEYEFMSCENDSIWVNTTDGWVSMKLQGKEYLVKSQKVERTDWQMIALIPVSELNRPARRIGELMILVSVIILLAAFLCIHSFSKWFTKRLYRLSKSMVSVREGNLDIQLDSGEEDEIGMLYDSFHYMLSKMKEYTKQQYENGKRLKSAELKVMQAQINPHFLYNTLDLINWEAMEYNVPEIARITQRLARFYKLGLKKGKDIVRIEDELEHISVYVEIQNCRFNDRISLIIDVSEEVRYLAILKIILQPLVENSILHGIMESNQELQGTIKVTGKRENDTVFLEIEDDGIGMTKTEIENILSESGEPSKGYGVRNINTRLKLYYGEEYGLRYESKKKIGTKVTIIIPAQEL